MRQRRMNTVSSYSACWGAWGWVNCIVYLSMQQGSHSGNWIWTFSAARGLPVTLNWTKPHLERATNSHQVRQVRLRNSGNDKTVLIQFTPASLPGGKPYSMDSDGPLP